MTRWFWIAIATWIVGVLVAVHVVALLHLLDQVPIWVCVVVGYLLGAAALIHATWVDVRAFDRRQGWRA